jgi:mono/diheme cytochrome c family protein
MLYGASQGGPRNVAILIALVLTIGWLLYIVVNLRRGRPEVGSELELAPNRRPYHDDDELEGRHLERVQVFGLAMLVILGVGLPLYWVHEPGRQAGAINGYTSRFAGWGAQLFDVTANGGFNCAGCHGGMKATGGVAAYVVTDKRTGQVSAVQWKAPALNTVLLRYTPDEVLTILTYGRPFSPMSPWGLAGGGPMNDQQLQDVIAYLKSIQLCNPDTTKGVCAPAQQIVSSALSDAMASGKYASQGEALFNLDVASGAYSCARCHTQGWSYGDPGATGSGAYGPSLIGGVGPRHFPAVADQIAWVNQPPGVGKKYGQQNQQFKPMPGFARLLTADQIKAIVDYERGL